MNTIRDAAVITTAGAVGLYLFGRPVLRAWRARSWPRAPGTVTLCRVESSSGVPFSDNTGQRGSRYVVRVSYRYSVGHAAHSSDRVTFFPALVSHNMRQWAEEQRKRYAEGTTIDVRYDPRDASQAVIETGVPGFFYVAVALAGLFLAGGLVGVLRILL